LKFFISVAIAIEQTKRLLSQKAEHTIYGRFERALKLLQTPSLAVVLRKLIQKRSKWLLILFD